MSVHTYYKCDKCGALYTNEDVMRMCFNSHVDISNLSVSKTIKYRKGYEMPDIIEVNGVLYEILYGKRKDNLASDKMIELCTHEFSTEKKLISGYLLE